MKSLTGTRCHLHVTQWMFWTWVITLALKLHTASAVCPSGCVCDDDVLFVNCNDARLDFVPITLNPLIQKLLLRNNRIRSVEGFGFYHELNSVDLSHNHLLKITLGSFPNQEKLTELRLNNNKITTLSNQTFGSGSGYHGTHTSPQYPGLISLIHLNLRTNLLERIEPGVFLNTKSIQELDLGQNSLRELDPGVFQGLDTLRILRLDHNDFPVVPGVFGGSRDHDRTTLDDLAELFLNTNPLQILEAGGFERLESLVVLDLKECHLGVIHSDAFRGLGKLQKLILSNNNLKSVPSSAFGSVRHLEMLKIGQNPFSTLDPSCFRTLTRLKVLEIIGAPDLVKIAQDAFGFNMDLELVAISNAKLLTTLPSHLFRSIRSLRSLNLQNNGLKTVPEDLALWPSLHSIHLQGNQFRCSCELSWLRDVLTVSQYRNASKSLPVLCDEPVALKGFRLSDVRDTELNCSEPSPWQQTLLGLALSLVIIFLVLFFFLLYRFHDTVKTIWNTYAVRRGDQEGTYSRRACATVKASEIDISTKSLFLSHHTHNYSGVVPKHVMLPASQCNCAHALNPITLQRMYYQRCYFSPFDLGSSTDETFCADREAEYESPLSLGLGLGSNGNHYAVPGRPSSIRANYKVQVFRAVPLTEL